MTRLLKVTLTLFGGVLLGAGVSYAWRRAAQSTGPASAQLGEPAPANDWRSSLDRSDAAVQALLDEAAEVEVELLDADFDEGEGYDTVSFEELGAQWLARATQTSGSAVSSTYDDASGLDLRAGWKRGRAL